MTTTIKTKNSTTASSVPSNGSLSQGELAVNIADKRIFIGDASGNPTEISFGYSGSTEEIEHVKTSNTSPLLNLKLDSASTEVGDMMHFSLEGDTYNTAELGFKDDSVSKTFYIVKGATGLKFYNFSTSSFVAPCGELGADRAGQVDLGGYNNQFKNIYRSGSTLSGSDRNKKQDIRDLTEAESRVATVAKNSLKAFRYIDRVQEEGDDAKICFGIMAQELRDAFIAEGLDANDYQMFKTFTHTNENGVEETTYAICYENLLAFIVATL